MTTRRQFTGSIPAASAAFAVGAGTVSEERAAFAQTAPLQGHFHPKGSAPSQFTKDILKRTRSGLPFDDTRNFDELNHGFIAPMPDLKIMADAGHVA